MTTPFHDARAHDDLDEWLDGPEPDWDDPPEPPPDLNRANGMARRLLRLRAEIDQARALAALRREQIDAWLDARESELAIQARWLEAALRRYHEAVLVLDERTATIHLPDVTLRSKRGQREWEVDEPKVMEWAMPEPLRQRLAAAAATYLVTVNAVLKGSPLPDAVRLRPPAPPELARDGLKAAGTRRDAKNKAVGWGVTPDGKPIPGVTVNPPERTFTVVPRAENDADEGDA